MTTRNQGSGALKRNREAVKEILKKNIDTGQTIIDNPKEGNQYKTWPLREAKANLTQFKESYGILFNQVLVTLEKEATVAGRTEDEVQVLLDKEHEASFSILAAAQGMIAALTALKEEIDSEDQKKLEEQARNDRLQENSKREKVSMAWLVWHWKTETDWHITGKPSGHMYRLLNDGSRKNSFLVERAVVGLLRLAIRLLFQDDISDEVLQSLGLLQVGFLLLSFIRK